MADTIIAPEGETTPAGVDSSSAELEVTPEVTPAEVTPEGTPEEKPAGTDSLLGDGEPEKVEGEPEAPTEEGADPYADVALIEDSLLSEQHLAGLKEFAKSSELSAEQATAMLERDESLIQSKVDGDKAAFDQQAQTWKEEVLADADIGGQNWPAAKQHALHFTTEVFGPEFAQMLIESKLGNHPGYLRGAVKFGERMAESNHLPNGGPAADSKGPSMDDWFPNSPGMGDLVGSASAATD